MFDQLPRPGGKNKIPHFPAKNGFGEFLGKDRGKSVVTREGNEKVISPALTLSLSLSLALSPSPTCDSASDIECTIDRSV